MTAYIHHAQLHPDPTHCFVLFCLPVCKIFLYLTPIELAFCLCLVLGKTVSAKRLMVPVPSWSSKSRIGRSGVGGSALDKYFSV